MSDAGGLGFDMRHQMHKARVSMGSVLHLAGALAPLLIHEMVKDREKAWRYVRISAAVTAAVSGFLWQDRVKSERESAREADPVGYGR